MPFTCGEQCSCHARHDIGYRLWWGVKVGEQDPVGVFGVGAACESSDGPGHRIGRFGLVERDPTLGGYHQASGVPYGVGQEGLYHF